MVKFVLKGLIKASKNPTMLNDFNLRIGDIPKRVHLHLPVAFVVTDTQGADKLCGHYLVYKKAVSHIHRACDCSGKNSSSTTKKCQFVTMENMMNYIKDDDKNSLISASQHCISDHAFQDVSFGDNDGGICGATPNDTPHGVQLGVVLYMLQIFHKELNPASC